MLDESLYPPPPPSGGDLVYEAEVHSTSQVYSAESNVLLIRVTEGSAVATFASDTGRRCACVCVHVQLSQLCVTVQILN